MQAAHNGFSYQIVRLHRTMIDNSLGTSCMDTLCKIALTSVCGVTCRGGACGGCLDWRVSQATLSVTVCPSGTWSVWNVCCKAIVHLPTLLRNHLVHLEDADELVQLNNYLGKRRETMLEAGTSRLVIIWLVILLGVAMATAIGGWDWLLAAWILVGSISSP